MKPCTQVLATWLKLVTGIGSQEGDFLRRDIRRTVAQSCHPRVERSTLCERQVLPARGNSHKSLITALETYCR